MPVDPKLTDLLGQAFELARDRADDPNFDSHKWEFAFHMTDWQSDLEKRYRMDTAPSGWAPDSACDFLIGFLIHTVPHLNAAARLLVDDVGDPFSQRHG
jgi:hypothetical protein